MADALLTTRMRRYPANREVYLYQTFTAFYHVHISFLLRNCFIQAGELATRWPFSRCTLRPPVARGRSTPGILASS